MNAALLRAVVIAGAAWLGAALPASAQVAPSAAEVAVYTGLHAATWRG